MSGLRCEPARSTTPANDSTGYPTDHFNRKDPPHNPSVVGSIPTVFIRYSWASRGVRHSLMKFARGVGIHTVNHLSKQSAVNTTLIVPQSTDTVTKSTPKEG